MTLRLPNTVEERGPQENFDFLGSKFPIRTDDIDNDAVTAAKIAAGAVDSSEIATNAVGSDEIAAGAVGEPELNLPWATWSPSLTNMAVWDGAETARYVQIDKTVFFLYTLIFGASSTITGNPAISPPLTIGQTAGSLAPLYGSAYMRDASTGTNFYGAVYETATLLRPLVYDASTGPPYYLRHVDLSATVPFTWTTSDELHFSGFYETSV